MVGIHVTDVLFAKIATVKNKTYLLIAIRDCLIDHASELRYISDRTRIFFIKQRNTIRLIKGNGNIEYWNTLVILGFAEFDKIHVSSLAVLVSGIVRNINPLFLIPSGILVIKKSDDLVASNR